MLVSSLIRCVQLIDISRFLIFRSRNDGLHSNLLQSSN